MPGVWFWSLRGLRGGVAGVAPGPVWRVSVASATLAGARPWGADPDVNGDGIAEVFAAARSDALYIYVGGASGPSVPPVTLSAPFDATGFARSFDFVGDVNGDGYGDVAVGASGSDNFYVFRGGPTGLSAASPWSVTGARGSGFGAAISPAGDVNGDGYDDLVVGYSSAGSLVFVPGGAAGLGAPVRLVGASYRGGSGVGDVNGDGYADVQSGADLLLGGATGLDLSRVRAGAGGIPAGDVNGDGLGDVVWGSAVRLGSTTSTGSVVALPFGTSGHVGQFSGDFNRDGYSDVVWIGRFGAAVVPGSSSGPTSAVVYNGPGFGAVGGWATQGGGDVDGDGYEDLIDLDDSVVLVLRGSATGIAATTTWTFDVTPVFGLPTGAMPHPAGDVNHDGRDDLAIGTWDGQLSLHHGSATGPSATAAARATYLLRAGSTTQHLIPHGGGDLNGDTFGDLVLEANEGALAPFAALTYGTATGLNLTPVWLPRPATVGRSVVIAGDLNGDRIADAALAAGSSLNVIYGRAGAVDPAGTSIAVPAAEVDAAGDVNHDGYADLLVQPTPAATAVIYPGSASGLRTTALSTLATAGVATPIGDVNADGYADIAVTSAAGVSVYYGSPSGTGPSEALRYPGALSVIALGDVDRDGDADIATTGFEIYYSYPVSLHRGGPSGVEASTWRVWYAPAGAAIARGPRGSGDFDGDGATDVAWLRDNQVFTNRLGSFASATQSLPTASGVIVYDLIR
ncbi:MAG: VCBS repeat-containing protein [Polyangiales bacterium]